MSITTKPAFIVMFWQGCRTWGRYTTQILMEKSAQGRKNDANIVLRFVFFFSIFVCWIWGFYMCASTDLTLFEYTDLSGVVRGLLYVWHTGNDTQMHWYMKCEGRDGGTEVQCPPVKSLQMLLNECFTLNFLYVKHLNHELSAKPLYCAFSLFTL